MNLMKKVFFDWQTGVSNNNLCGTIHTVKNFSRFIFRNFSEFPEYKFKSDIDIDKMSVILKNALCTF